jgi:hypothetical protein
MICFEIRLNGKKTHTAGVRDGVLSFDVTAQTDKEGKNHVMYALSGLTEERGFEEYVWWDYFTKVSPGDVLTIRVFSAKTADEPTKRERKRKRTT